MTMRISDLRKKAHEMRLDVDGSREMLIATLKEAEAYLDVSSNDNSDEESDYEFIEDADEDSEDDLEEDAGEESDEESETESEVAFLVDSEE